MRDHTKLEAFQLADALVLAIYKATRDFPDDEKFGLVTQMRRAAISMAANIVEASARPTKADYARMLSIAYASAKELQYEVSLATRLEYLPHPSAADIAEQTFRTAKALWGLVAAVRRLA